MQELDNFDMFAEDKLRLTEVLFTCSAGDIARIKNNIRAVDKELQAAIDVGNAGDNVKSLYKVSNRTLQLVYKERLSQLQTDLARCKRNQAGLKMELQRQIQLIRESRN